MVNYQQASKDNYDEFLQLTLSEAGYIEETLNLMQLSWEEFCELFRTIGQVYGVYDDDVWAGYIWLEERERILHLHGIILREECRGNGIGTTILGMLVDEYRENADAIELGVHQSNQRAIRLYERLGFQTVKTYEDLEFFVMQKELHGISL